MDQIPSLIEEDIQKINPTLEPFSLSGNNLAPVFYFRENRFITLSISFLPQPVCSCSDYHRNKIKVCYHILTILRYYYHISMLSLRMFHKWDSTYYQSLFSYYDNWLQQNGTNLRKARKRKPYNFYAETKNMKLDEDNKYILNPVLPFYQEEECAICLDTIGNGSPLIICSQCSNYSHAKCINKWKGKNNGCHLCRKGSLNLKKSSGEEFPSLS